MPDSAPLKEIRLQLKTRMDKAVEDFRKAMAATRTGRASVHMLDGVSVEYYGSQMPLNQIAQVHAPEPQMITVQPFDPSQVGAIEKAIRSAELGLNPMNDGKLIRVPVPALTYTKCWRSIAQRFGISGAMATMPSRKRPRIRKSPKTTRSGRWMKFKNSPTMKSRRWKR
jgi:ribosome recycling factor